MINNTLGGTSGVQPAVGSAPVVTTAFTPSGALQASANANIPPLENPTIEMRSGSTLGWLRTQVIRSLMKATSLTSLRMLAPQHVPAFQESSSPSGNATRNSPACAGSPQAPT